MGIKDDAVEVRALDLDNLPMFRALPHLDEVSIGHALMSRALFVGLDTAVREYLAILL